MYSSLSASSPITIRQSNQVPSFPECGTFGGRCTSYDINLVSPQLQKRHMSISKQQRVVNEGKWSRNQPLTQLLLSEAALFRSHEAAFDTSGTLIQQPSNLVTQELFRQLYANLNRIQANEIIGSSVYVPSQITLLPSNVSVQEACKHLAKQPSPKLLLLYKGDQVMPLEKAVAQGLSFSDCESILTLDDLHAFFTTLFCSQRQEATCLSPSHGLASPPPSPSIGKVKTLYQQESVEQRKEIQAKLLANHPISAKLVANLGGRNQLRTLPSDTSLFDLVRVFSDQRVGSVVLFEAQGNPGQPQSTRSVCGVITETDLVSFLLHVAEQDESIASVFEQSIEQSPVSELCSRVLAIHSDKTVLDAMVRMDTDSVPSLAVLDSGGGFLSSISSSEIAKEVLTSSSKRILTTPLSTVIKSLRSRDPEGIDGKDVHPAVCVSIGSSIARTAALVLATQSQGLFVLEDHSSMVSSLSTLSIPPSPSREQSSSWQFMHDSSQNSLQVLDCLSDHGKTRSPRSKFHTRSSSFCWSMPRSRTSIHPTGLLSFEQQPCGVRSSSPSSDVSASGSHSRSSTSAAPGIASQPSNLSLFNVAIPTVGASKMQGHRPRSLSLAINTLVDRSSPKRDASANSAGSVFPTLEYGPTFSKPYSSSSALIAAGDGPVSRSKLSRALSLSSSWSSQGSTSGGGGLGPGLGVWQASSSLSVSPSSPYSATMGASFFGDTATMNSPSLFVSLRDIIRLFSGIHGTEA